MVADRLRQSDAAAGFILDCFPRTTDQANWPDAMLGGTGAIDAVIVLDAPIAILRERATLRGCGDDTSQAIDRRLSLYRQQTEPLLAAYSQQLVTIDADQTVKQVHHDIITTLSSPAVSGQ